MYSVNKMSKLIKWLNTNMELYEMPKYEVTEISTKNRKHTYFVYNLYSETEDDGIYFSDLEEKIITKGYALMGFLVESVNDINFSDKIIEIIFDTNSIKIELI